MERVIEALYLMELLNQCDCASKVADKMNKLLQERPYPPESFMEAEHLLQHSSAISRFLWPPGIRDKLKDTRAKERGKYLREKLGVSSNHVLQDRTLRDHIEHFDERLDDWAETSHHRNMVDRFIGPRSQIGGDAIGDKDIIRLYDPETNIFIFRGEEYNIQKLVDGIADIQQRALQRFTHLRDYR